MPCALAVVAHGPAVAEGPKLAPEQHHHRQNGPELDDHVEHFLEGVRHAQRDKLIRQNEVPRAGDGQPFRNALHNAQNGRFQQI